MIPITNWKLAPDSLIVCWCCNKTLGDIKAAIADGARTLDDVTVMTGACLGSRCEINSPAGRCCSTDIEKIISIYAGR